MNHTRQDTRGDLGPEKRAQGMAAATTGSASATGGSARASGALPAGFDPATRVLVLGSETPDVFRALCERGLEQVLVLAPPERVDALRREVGAVRRDCEGDPRIQPWTSRDQAWKHDAEVLWLDGDSVELLWSSKSLRPARQIVAPALAGPRAALFARRLIGLAQPRGRFELAARRWSLHDVPGETKVRARRYLSPTIGLPGFFAALERARVRYVVLRWWEELPERAQGDVDLLVHDDDAERLLAALGPGVGTIPLDVYASHGALGLGYRGATYYPAELALGILERGVLTPRGVRRPAPADAPFVLAFHALYHKGTASGLATTTSGVTPTPMPKHDFARVVRELAAAGGVALPSGTGHGEALTMEQLDEFLAEHGWRPPRDMLRKWANRNAWIKARHFAGSRRAIAPGWCVFVVRSAALEAGLAGAIEQEIVARGFRVLAREPLDAEAAGRFSRHARGGNWGQGEFAAHGGAPALFLVTHDPRPLPTRRRFARRYPDMDNGRIVEKRAIRDAVNARLPEAARANFLHTSDNSDEAWEYVRIAFPERAEVLRRELEARVAGG